MTQNVFDHDDRAVYHHAKVQGAEREQIRRDAADVQENSGKHQREGDGNGNDERAADVAQEKKQNEADQQHAVGQVAQHGSGRVVHQYAAVEMGERPSRL